MRMRSWKRILILAISLLFFFATTAQAAPPSITSLSITTGAVGASVTITGTNFGSSQGSSTVKFNGTVATVTSWTATSIATKVPTGATTGNVVVTVSNHASNGVSFTVVPAPSITSLSVTSGAVGASVTITGTNFGSSQGSGTVKFNGTAATVGSWNATTIAVTVPSGATTGNVVVHASGVDSNGSSFTVLPTPTITSLNPTSGIIGASVTITGTNFGSSQGSSTVNFNGTAATPTSWNATSIGVPVPSGATTGNVVVHASGVDTNGVAFTVVPNITSLSPTSGAVGVSVTITGTGFGGSQGSSTVKFNGTTASPTSWSATSIAVPVPTGATTGNVVVHASGVDSNGVTFTVSPSISSLSVTSGPTGTAVTISGLNFGGTQGTSTVTFNGAAATPTSWSAASIAAPVPSSASTGPVVVTVGGVASNGVTFSVVPNIASLSPSSGGVKTFVTISGTAFGSSQGSSTVTFNGTTALPSGWTNTSIVVPVPSNATTGPVVVTVSGLASSGVTFSFSATGSFSGTISKASDGTAISGATIQALQSGVSKGSATSASDGTYSIASLAAGNYDVRVSANGFSASTQTGMILTGGQTTQVNARLGVGTITSLSPTGGPAGTSVAILGSSFGASQFNSYVTFNGALALPSSWSDTKIVVPVPAAATTGPVVVYVGGIATNGVTFSIGVGTISGTITQASNGSPISGALVEALQAGLVIASTTSASDGTYSISNLLSGSYDVRITASGFGTSIQSGTSVVAGSPTVLNVALSSPGTIAGQVTQSDGITAISGASLTVLQGLTTAGTATTNASGNYSVGTLSAGSYSVQVTANGYGPQTSTGITVSSGNSTPANFTLSGQSTISYTYDELGRLVGVADSQNGAAGYSYDSVGNLLAISRSAAGQVAILSFTPKSGPVGTVVTISGTNFSTTPSQNAVTFGGTSASVSSSSSTQIVASVPTGATTGTINVTAPAGSATSSGSFTVGSIAGAPTISGFTPSIAAAGTAVTINGTNFDTSPTRDNTMFNVVPGIVTSATSTAISTSVPGVGTSGRLSVTTALGKAVSSSDFFVPPSPYTASVVGFTGRVGVGSTITVTLGTTNQIGLVVFDGTAGQSVNISAANKTISAWTDIIVYTPTGSTLTSLTVTGSTGFLGTQTLPIAGTYTILVHPETAATGNIDLTVAGPSNTTGTIVAGGPAVTVNSPTIGQKSSLLFIGSAGQRISLNMTNKTVTDWTDINIFNPDGTTLSSLTITGSTGLIDATNLTQSGIYTIQVSPERAGVGNITLQLYSVTDITGTITENGVAVTVTTTTPGQNANLTFSGSSGQRISLNMTNKTVSDWTDIYIFNPDGTTLSSLTITGSTGFIDATNLTQSGTYTIQVNPERAGVGSITLQLYAFTDITGSVTINGSAVPLTISTPGQNASLTFSVTSSQQVTVHITNNTVGLVVVKLLDPSNATLTSTTSSNTNFNLASESLTTTGTYTVVVDPQGAATGTISASVTSP